MFDKLSFEDKTALWEVISEYITPERQAIYDRILQYRTRHFTIAVEDIFQEHNAGALTRTAECYGVQDLHVMKNHNEFKIAKGMAKGASQWIDAYKFDGENSVVKCMDFLRNKGYQIVATTPDSSKQHLKDFDISNKSAFFFGTEKNGLDNRVFEQADQHLHVPIYGVTESFNVSITASVILHELTSKLHQANFDWQLTPEEQVTKRLEWAYGTLNRSEILYRNSMKLINPALSWRPVPKIVSF